MQKKFYSILFLLLCSLSLQAQLTGTKTIPGDYADLQTAITDLNTVGVGAGGVTFTLGANQAISSAVLIGSPVLNSSAVSGNPVVINGNGFTVTASYAGLRAGSSAGATGFIDAIFVVRGTDNVKFQNIVFDELPTNTTGTTAMEAAISFLNAATTAGSADGCQNDTVTSCTFNLNKINATTAYGFGVHIAPYIYSTTSTSIASWNGFGTTPSDMHRSIVVSNNIFNGGNNYVCYRGVNGVNGRDIRVVNNQMNNVGGSGASNYGFYAIYLDSIFFNGNTLSLNATHTSTLYGAFLSTNCGGFQQLNNNNVTLASGTTTSTTYGLYSTSIGANREMNNNDLSFGSFPNLTTGAIYGVYGTYSGGNNNILLDMSNNTCTSKTLTLPATTTSSSVYLFYNVGNTGTNRKVRMNNNTITGFTRSGGGGSTFCIYPGTADSVLVQGNTINGYTHTNTSASSTSNFYGIYGNGSQLYQMINQNVVQNILIGGTSTATTSILQPIRSSTTSAGFANVQSNLVKNVSFDVGTTTGNIIGIYTSLGSTTVNNNVVDSLIANQASGSINGIQIISGTTNNVYNNQISDLQTPAATGSNALIGLNVSGGTNANLYHNTIYLGSNTPLSGGATFGASGIQIGSSVNVVSRNNIVNVKGAGGTTSGYIIAFRRSTGTASVKPANVTASNNLYNVTNNSSSYIYGEGTSVFTNLYYISGASVGTADPAFNTSCGLYKTFMQENGTFNEDQLSESFTNGIGIFSPTSASYAEAVAFTPTTPAVTIDLLNVARPATPDIGAVEYTGTATDLSGPSITFTDISSTTNFCTNPTIIATISDNSGLNNTTGSAPRVWYRKATNSNVLPATNDNTTDGWKWVEATSGSPYSLTIDYAKIFGGVASGDVIEYFVIAQDLVSTPNVSTNSVIFSSPYCAGSVALATAAFPVSGAKSFTILTPATAGTLLGTPAVNCSSGTPTLNLLATGGSLVGLDFEIFSSPAGANTWSLVGTSNTLPYTAPAITASTDYQITVKNCNNATVFNSNVIAISVNTPLITSTTPASRCGAGTLSLSATASATNSVLWYDAATGGNLLGTGNNFTTPSISTTTTYYAAAGGLPDSAAVPLASGSTTGVNHHMFTVRAINFVVLSGMKIKCNMAVNTPSTWTVYYRPNNYKTIAGANTNAAGWTLLTTVTTPSAGASNYTPILFNQAIAMPAGDTFSFYIAPATGTTHQYSSAGINTVTGSNADLEISAGNRGSSLFSLTTSGGQAVVNMIYNKGCVSTPATPVVATIQNAAANAHLTTNTVTTMSTTTNSCDDGSGWTYYTDPSDATKFLFGIQWNPTNAAAPDDNAAAKAAASVQINLDANAGSAKGGSGSTAEGTWTMKRYWNVDIGSNTISTTNPVNVRFFYDAAEKAAVNDSATLWNTANVGSAIEPATWFKTKSPSGAFVPNATRVTIPGVTQAIPLTDANTAAATLNGVLYAQFNGISSFSGGTYATGVGPQSPLPLYVVNLTATNQGARNLVRWESSREEDAGAYIVERSNNGTSFEAIATIAALGKASVYQYYDERPYGGVNFYRLLMKSKNGSFEYSKVVSATVSNNGFAVNAFPNPAKDKVTIAVSGTQVQQAQVRLTDLTGKTIKIVELNGNQVEVSLQGMAQGIYMLHYTDGANSSTIKLEVK